MGRELHALPPPLWLKNLNMAAEYILLFLTNSLEASTQSTLSEKADIQLQQYCLSYVHLLVFGETDDN